jgi:hypothetical protein
MITLALVFCQCNTEQLFPYITAFVCNNNYNIFKTGYKCYEVAQIMYIPHL